MKTIKKEETIFFNYLNGRLKKIRDFKIRSIFRFSLTTLMLNTVSKSDELLQTFIFW